MMPYMMNQAGADRVTHLQNGLHFALNLLVLDNNPDQAREIMLEMDAIFVDLINSTRIIADR